MTTSTFRGPFGVLRIERDYVDVTLDSAHRQFVPGTIDFYLNDVPISEEEAKRIVAEAREALDR